MNRTPALFLAAMLTVGPAVARDMSSDPQDKNVVREEMLNVARMSQQGVPSPSARDRFDPFGAPRADWRGAAPPYRRR